MTQPSNSWCGTTTSFGHHRTGLPAPHVRAGPTGFGERGRSALPAATIKADPEGRREEGPIVATAETTRQGGGQDASRASELGVRSLVVFFLLAFGTKLGSQVPQPPQRSEDQCRDQRAEAALKPR